MSVVHSLFQKVGEERPPSQFFPWCCYYSATKTKQRHLKKKKRLHTNISHELRRKNHQPNLFKYNYIYIYIYIYDTMTKNNLCQLCKTNLLFENQYSLTHEQGKEEISFDYIIWYRKIIGFFSFPLFRMA